MLIVGLVAVAYTVFLDLAVAANVKNSRGRRIKLLWYIEVAGNVQARKGLKMYLLNNKIIVLNPAGDNRLKVGFGRQRVKAEHFKKLLFVNCAFLPPVVQSFHISQTPVAQSGRFSFEIVGEHAVAGFTCQLLR